MNPSVFSPEDEEKFRMAAVILASNKNDTKLFADRSNGITNGNSLRKSAEITKTLARINAEVAAPVIQ